MTNLHNNNPDNLVSFLRKNRPTPPKPSVNLEQQLMESISSHQTHKQKPFSGLIWGIPSAIATGFLFTSVSMGFKTPQVTVEVGELENFLVNSWNDTLDSTNYGAISEDDAYWLLPVVPESPQTLSLSR